MEQIFGSILPLKFQLKLENWIFLNHFKIYFIYFFLFLQRIILNKTWKSWKIENLKEKDKIIYGISADPGSSLVTDSAIF